MVEYTKEQIEHIVDKEKGYYIKSIECAKRNIDTDQITLPIDDFVIILESFGDLCSEYSGAPGVDYVLSPIYRKYAQLLGIY